MQNDDTNTRHDAGEPLAPDKLVAALKEPSSRRVFVPPAIDAAVLKAAHQHLVKPQKPGFHFFRSWLIWPAVATACLALIGLVYFIKPQKPSTDIAREDLNRDGHVDILDAFQLARELRSGKTTKLDLNGDGITDQRDADVIAAHVVKLEKGGRS